jgi:Zn2+/Cd2+-exporting ATPase
MKEAIFADVGVALLAIFNSMRILNTIKDKVE